MPPSPHQDITIGSWELWCGHYHVHIKFPLQIIVVVLIQYGAHQARHLSHPCIPVFSTFLACFLSGITELLTGALLEYYISTPPPPPLVCSYILHTHSPCPLDMFPSFQAFVSQLSLVYLIPVCACIGYQHPVMTFYGEKITV